MSRPNTFPCIMVVMALLAAGCLHNATAAVAVPATAGEANHLVEWTFTSSKSYPDPFNDVALDMLVHCPDGTDQRVPAFWAGGQNWRVRYSSPQTGTHQWKLDCSDHANPDLDGISGTLAIRPYAGTEPLYRHGFVHVAADHRHFQYRDGTPFFWFADTWWMGLCSRMSWPEDIQKLATDRKQKGFNVIQIVAGLYPDMPPFDPRGANEAGYPWEAEYTRIRPEYFDAADKRLEYLAEQGFSPCIVGAWGYFLPWMGVDKMKQHWRYLIARYGALPVFWCAAGEGNMSYYLGAPPSWDATRQVTGWTEVMRYIHATDPYHRPLTIHPTGGHRLSARVATDDISLLDFDMLQTPHGQRDAVEPTVNTVRESYADKPTMPVIDGEAAYEMLGDSLPTRWTRQMFWLAMTNGAVGHTYGANGIWQVNRRGHPHGPSPYMPPTSIGYGIIAWDDAMNLPGSSQESYGKQLFEQFAWQTFVPHHDWASFRGEQEADAPWGQWIWYPEGNPTQDAPEGKRYFRKIIDVPEGAHIGHASLSVAADDLFVAYVNGEEVGHGNGWNVPVHMDVTARLNPGRNIIAVQAENLPTRGGHNPAGLIAKVDLHVDSGAAPAIVTDASWLCAKEVSSDAWKSLAFTATDWVPSQQIGAYGCNPWGLFSTQPYGPFVTGNDTVRVIYVPELRNVQVTSLEPTSHYQVWILNPASGLKTDLGVMTSTAASILAVDAPVQHDAIDWVLITQHVQ